MKKKTITADEIEAELKKMGAIEITEDEFSKSPEYKVTYKYYRENVDITSADTHLKKHTEGKKQKVKS